MAHRRTEQKSIRVNADVPILVNDFPWVVTGRELMVCVTRPLQSFFENLVRFHYDQSVPV